MSARIKTVAWAQLSSGSFAAGSRETSSARTELIEFGLACFARRASRVRIGPGQATWSSVSSVFGFPRSAAPVGMQATIFQPVTSANSAAAATREHLSHGDATTITVDSKPERSSAPNK